ncbi:MAG: hypothetical protein K8F34_04555 [Candidatus Kuenenia stuttgartiensis]|uniref:Uncharacterized protein n=1 Tax=Kuenenia stuttgartiensis TaxID=174633 RepID=A0A2C9CCT1_KUEST|nr:MULTISPECIES: hypothetical protein [Kuenenia]MBZ0190943.1 hypothetical protein [Candidatus Kuenenia stuttgartiensis]MCZ7622172.1 hypothetical protein [Candidatus Kuenenia sp.]GJQ48179.1 MAG: hypothetical protein HKUEN01_05650 [Candidatus Kuenenia stuttgartiensis]SOH03388.1 hypothetical protein KSMBR1_0877 [Candidatus Kuenenia stuttgartiensis]
MSKLKIIAEEKATEEIVKSAISAEIKRLEIGLNRTNREIKEFEGEYEVSSEIFLKEFTTEDLKGGDDEYITWAGELKIRDRILDELKKLKDIEYVNS